LTESSKSVLHGINQHRIRCFLVNVFTESGIRGYYLLIMYSVSLILGLRFSIYLF